LSGEEKYLAGRQELANIDGGIDSVHVFHNDVADNQVGPLASGFLDSSGAAVNCSRCESVLVQDNCQSVGDYALVIDYQNFGFTFSAVVICHPSCPWIPS